MFQKDAKILFIGAHPDDIEFGAGGTLAQLAKTHDVMCATLSHNIRVDGKENIPGQHIKSLKSLGVPKDKILLKNFNSRHFHHEDRQNIADYFWELKRKYNPNVVITHSGKDLHRDHIIVAQEAQRPFRDRILIGYEVARSTNFSPNLFIEIDKKALEKKLKALENYKGFYPGRSYFNEEAIRALAITRGVQIEKPHAEAFEVIRFVA